MKRRMTVEPWKGSWQGCILYVLALVVVLVVTGCSSDWRQPGETYAETHHRHKRITRLNQGEMMADLDAFWLYDRPGMLTDKRIP